MKKIETPPRFFPIIVIMWLVLLSPSAFGFLPGPAEHTSKVIGGSATERLDARVTALELVYFKAMTNRCGERNGTTTFFGGPFSCEIDGKVYYSNDSFEWVKTEEKVDKF